MTLTPRHQRGFGLIAAIVILVILAGLAAFVVAITTTQHLSFALDIQSARAYQVARAGTEWGIARWASSGSCDALGAPAALEGFDLAITATRTPDTPATDDPEFCVIEVTASVGTPGASAYVERRLRAVVEGN